MRDQKPTTIQVAKDREFDPTKSVIPAEVARGIVIEHAPSAAALKLMHLMIAVAGGRMGDDTQHTLRGGDIRQVEGMRKHDVKSLRPLFAELRAMTYHFEQTTSDPTIGRVDVGGFLDHAEIRYSHNEKGDITVKWYFSHTFKRIAVQSVHWAILDRQTVFSLRSKYSILLFQHLSTLFNLKHTNYARFTIQELRAILNVEEGKLERFANLNDRAIKPTLLEINQLSRFDVFAEKIKQGRVVIGIKFTWVEKADCQAVKAELERPKVGRKARRTGTTEKLVEGFPTSGRVFGSWEAIAATHAPKIDGIHTPDLTTLSEAFRKWCAEKSISLDASTIEKTFTSWCKKYHPR